MPTSTGSTVKTTRVVDLEADVYQRMLSECPAPKKVSVKIGMSMFDIYSVAEAGVLLGPDGEEVEVDPKELVKILDAHSSDEWCYRVVRLAVRMPGGNTVSLKTETPVAVLQKDFAERFGRRNGRDEGVVESGS